MDETQNRKREVFANGGGGGSGSDATKTKSANSSDGSAAESSTTVTTTTTSSSSSSTEYSLPCAATASVSEEAERAGPYNVFRDSPLRYMGYANEIGESFRYQFPRLVVPSYVLAFGYCGMDAATTGYRVWQEEGRSRLSAPQAGGPDDAVVTSSAEKKAAIAAADTLLWQTLASVTIPGATINMIVRAARFGVARTAALPAAVAKWFPTFAGIGSIPVIVHPIDNAVDYALDNTTRTWYKG